ncbi:hypothetical protein ACFLYA_02330 [Candidatus Dependentiae bacterium]
MKQICKKIFLSNMHIKIISLIFGYSFWYLLSQSHVANIWFTVPICFYNVQDDIQIETTEKIKVQLSAKREDLYTVEQDNLAFHIDAQDTKIGNTVIKLQEKQLLLPNAIKMVKCYPTNIAISVEKRDT